MKEITIDGITYVPKGSEVITPAKTLKGLKYVIVRTYSAGVFAGYLKKKVGQNVVLLNARRLWQWYGAASLSQLAMEGVTQPNKCKFPCELSQVELDQVIEVDKVTEAARLSIKNVPIWKA
jgi:hypothetical protein